MRFGRGQRRHALVFSLKDDRGVFAFGRLAMDDHPALVYVENPVVGDAGAGVEVGFRGKIKGQARSRDLGHQQDIFGLRYSPQFLERRAEHGQVRLRLVAFIDADWVLFVYQPKAKDCDQPLLDPLGRQYDAG